MTMRDEQTGPGGETIGLEPRYLVAPVGKEGLARQYTSVNYTAAAPADLNVFGGGLTPITDPRLDAASATAWYVVSDPNVEAAFVYGTLEQEDLPYTETRYGFDTDSVDFKIRRSFGAAAIEPRAAVKNDGA